MGKSRWLTKLKNAVDLYLAQQDDEICFGNVEQLLMDCALVNMQKYTWEKVTV